MKNLLYYFFIILSLAFSTAAWTDSVISVSAEDISLSKIEAERSIISSSLSLSDQQRQELQAKLDEAVNLLQQTDQLKLSLQNIQDEVKQAAGQIKKLQKEGLKIEPLDEKKLTHYNSDELKSLLEKLRMELETSRNNQDTQEKLLASYISLSKNGGAEIANINKKMDKLRSATSEVIVADRLLNAAQIQMLMAKHNLLRFKIDNLGVLTELSTVQRDQYAAQISLLQKNMDQLHVLLRVKAGEDLKTVNKIDDQSSNDLPDQIKTLQETINKLLQEQNNLQAESSIKSQRLDAVKRQLDEIRADQERIRQIIKIAGNNQQVSNLLQNRRTLIPPVSNLTEEVISLQSEMSVTVLKQLTLDETLRKIGTGTNFIDTLLKTTSLSDKTLNDQKIIDISRKTVDQYRSTIRELNKNYSAYIAQLSSLDALTRQLVDIAGTYRAFIDEHLLWMPSTDSIPVFQPVLLLNGFAWLVQPDNIELFLKDASHSINQNKLLTFLIIAVFSFLLFFRHKAISTIENAAIQTRKIRTDNFTATVLTLLATLVLALPAPVLLIGSGLLIGNTINAGKYTFAISAGLQGSGVLLFILLFLKYLCRKDGLLISHLRWQQELCVDIRKQASWLISLIVPLVFIFSMSAASVSSTFIYLANYVTFDEPGILAMGQLSFIAVMIMLEFSIYKIWHKNGAVLTRLKEAATPGRWQLYHVIWFYPLLMLPPAFALVTLAGYYYTATYLIAKIVLTIDLILIMVLFKDILVRSMYIIQRRLKFAEAVRIREEMKKLRESQIIEAGYQDIDSSTQDDEAIAYGIMSEQLKQLIKTGFFIGFAIILWWVWKDIIPALNFLNTFELPISTTTIIDGVSREVPLTLSDLLLGLLIGGLTLLAARSIPGLMEFTILQHLPIGLASRYAIKTLAQYFVAMLGIIISFNALGLQWSNIQWLVAALSVGLGFGLQEIVANFVSGIILLFEQPIRVGDVVTVDGISGTVSRIRIRATTILNWEKQELIVPNKTFITGQLVNWTLSDTLNRVHIAVGVAYGTDTVKAMKLLREAADEHPKVLKEPEPRVTFEEFGDNSLNLRIRAYLNNIDDRLPTITELNQAVNDKFNEAGIVIAFPQRDLHIDSSQPLEIILKESPAN